MDSKERPPFDLAPDGNIITHPLLGYSVVPVAGTTILARLEYAETEEQLRTGGKAVQLVFGPRQALELADILTKQANRILGQATPGAKN